MYFRVINKGTKKAEQLISTYKWYTSRYGLLDLSQAYKTASAAKWRAWRDICALCERLNGHGLTVLGHNDMKYSAAFIATENGIEKLFYFTADNSYEIAM